MKITIETEKNFIGSDGLPSKVTTTVSRKKAEKITVEDENYIFEEIRIFMTELAKRHIARKKIVKKTIVKRKHKPLQ